MSERAYLGIYSPESPHESAQIVGTREGLEALYDALRRIFCGDDCEQCDNDRENK